MIKFVLLLLKGLKVGELIEVDVCGMMGKFEIECMFIDGLKCFEYLCGLMGN